MLKKLAIRILIKVVKKFQRKVARIFLRKAVKMFLINELINFLVKKPICLVGYTKTVPVGRPIRHSMQKYCEVWLKNRPERWFESAGLDKIRK